MIVHRLPYTIKKAYYSLEHEQCYNIVIGREICIYILQRVHRDILGSLQVIDNIEVILEN